MVQDITVYSRTADSQYPYN